MPLILVNANSANKEISNGYTASMGNGAVLTESDIIRIEDDYGRESATAV